MCFRNGATSMVARRESNKGGLTRLALLLLLIVSSLVLALVAGCSGGGSTGTPGSLPTPTPTPTPVPANPVTVKASIYWAPRSRDTTTLQNQADGPSSALSAVITLIGASTTGGNLTVTANRDTTQVTGYTGQYTLGPGQGLTGSNFALHVDFYTLANATGVITATADTTVGGAAIQANGTLSDIITTTGRIQSVVIGDVAINGVGQNGVLQVGQTADVTYAGYDGPNGTGDLIAVTPGSAFVTVTSGTAALTAQGDRVYAAAPTTGAMITVTMDPDLGGGVTSAAKSIKVGSSTAITLAAVSPPGGTTTAPIDSPGIPLPISATTTGDTSNSGAGSGVTLLLKEGSAAGTLSASSTTSSSGTVTYTPPATLPASPVTYHLIATSNYDPNVTVTIPIVVESLVSVTFVTPSTPQTISIDSTEQYNAVANLIPTGADATVSYAVTNSAGTVITTGGTISSSGLYTSPKTAGTYYIKATSNFDTTKSALQAVTVKSLVAITVAPSAPPAISIAGTEQFAATVTGVPTGQSTAVTWSVEESNGGTITSSGLYTAPSVIAPLTSATYHIVATSVFDPTTSVVVPITVQSFVTVSLTPATAKISVGGSQQYTATVNGVAAGGSTAVTWYVTNKSGGAPITDGSIGTVSSAGLYTAPSSVSNGNGTTFYIVAVSVFDPTKSAQSTVTVTSGGLGLTVN